MSKIENPKYFLKNYAKNRGCDDNALKNEKMWNNLPLIFLYIFAEKYLGIFLVSIYETNWNKFVPKNPK